MLPFTSLVSAEQLKPEMISEICQVTDYLARVRDLKGRTDLLSDKIIALIFLEPSSRTMLSFQSATQRLGAGVICLQGREMSSIEKGETIEDTMRVVSGYSDLVVARLNEAGAAAIAAKSCEVPFINGGDGGNQHPTQAIVDAYTIFQELHQLNGLHIAIGFDPLHSRSIHSLVELLSNYPGTRFTFVSPDSLRAPETLLHVLQQRNVAYSETEDLAGFADADVIYLNRLQAERFSDRSQFERHRSRYSLTASMVSPRNRLILDPLPRVGEIASDVDALPIAGYFRQAKNGIAVRMALLTMLLGRA